MNSISKKNENKEKHEEDIFKLAEANLRGIYRDYTVCETQKDKPDKAIVLSKPNPKLIRGWLKEPKVGIEITRADPREYLAYIADRKTDRKVIHAQIEEALTTRTAPQKPLKKIENRMHRDWLVRGIEDKASKHQSYVARGEFVELVLLCYSEIIDTTNCIYYDGLKEWTEYLLGQANFPFDRVLFIGGNNICEQLYKKSRKAKIEPSPFKYEGWTITSSTSGMIPLDVTYNYKEAQAEAPIIQPEQAIVDRRASASKQKRDR
ncbi:hypothetical protein [Pseudomonas fluorescens]|uniref:hypothetical protein n=1 Tax=Pseudomonas fluorescens TaxID=294 RepID=UPI000A5A52CA|nr:hypothetical protein [Pseudomonas fluorescens]